MVDVGAKPAVRREAVAEAVIVITASTARALSDRTVPKGDVFATARIAGIMAAKKCGDLIPLCHPLPIDSVTVNFEVPDIVGEKPLRIRILSTVAITARTGVEMEALTAVTIAALTIYDMCKALDKTMTIEGVRVVSKMKAPSPVGIAD